MRPGNRRPAWFAAPRGELMACAFCTSVWTAGALVCGYTAAPTATRLVCAGLGAVTMADWLQYAWTWTRQNAQK